MGIFDNIPKIEVGQPVADAIDSQEGNTKVGLLLAATMFLFVSGVKIVTTVGDADVEIPEIDLDE